MKANFFVNTAGSLRNTNRYCAIQSLNGLMQINVGYDCYSVMAAMKILVSTSNLALKNRVHFFTLMFTKEVALYDVEGNIIKKKNI